MYFVYRSLGYLYEMIFLVVKYVKYGFVDKLLQKKIVFFYCIWFGSENDCNLRIILGISNLELNILVMCYYYIMIFYYRIKCL